MKRIINLTVRTNAPETKITKLEGDHWRMDVHAKPEDNKANLEIIKYLAKQYKTDVKVISGRASKKKRIAMTLSASQNQTKEL